MAPSKAAEKEQEAERSLGLLEALGMLAGPPEDGAVCLAACQAIETATMRSSQCHARVLCPGGGQTVVAAMLKHQEDAEIQVAAICAIQHLVTSSEVAMDLVAAGACDAILSAMDTHSETLLLQQAACHALEMFAFAGPEASTAIVAKGGAEAVLRVLKSNRREAEVLRAAFATLQAMLHATGGVAQRILDDGGVAAMVSTLSDRKEDPLLLHWGQLMLQGLCAGNADLKADIKNKCHWKGVTLDLS